MDSSVRETLGLTSSLVLWERRKNWPKVQ